MAKRAQINGVRGITAEGGIHWMREKNLLKSERGRYEAELFGVRYELEMRSWSSYEPDCDTGWYLFSTNVTGFSGVWCARGIMEAVDAATKLILEKDLRKN